MSGMREKVAWAVAAALGLALVLSFAGIVRGGPLDPTAEPAPTMKTLADLPPSWHQNLAAVAGCASGRFVCVLGNTAVLDNETGLVWDKTPDTDTTWGNASHICYLTTIGGRQGWRLPTVEELSSIWTPGVTTAPRLPANHPFSFVLDLSTDFYWTQTTSNRDTTTAYAVSFASSGNQPFPFQEKLKTEDHNIWCVRGGEAHDAY